jgi:putative ABC transport system ATP-binding protein
LNELSAAERRRRVAKYLEVVGLGEFARHRPNPLSGGQRQRVATAGAGHASEDHPRRRADANLDYRTGRRILRLMRRINRKTGATFIFSTHDRRVIDMADRRVDLEDGEIIRLGIRSGKERVYAMERPEEPNDDDEDQDE